MDPNKEIIDYRLYREHCIEKKGIFIKDIRIINNRDVEKNVVVVDNCITTMASNLDNGIYVPTFFGQKGDTALKILIPFLKQVAMCENTQEFLKRKLGLSKLYATKKKEEIRIKEKKYFCLSFGEYPFTTAIK